MMGRTRSDVSAVGATETLRAQQQLLQKLYAELDEERESSATAAREAMSMILRLQGEKAAVEMEASQFKRMTDEKIAHVEAILEAFEELLYDKEMETASLKFQIQVYKDKLVSLGCDLNSSEFQYMKSNTSDQTIVMRRMKSMPPIPYKKVPPLSESVVRKVERPLGSSSTRVSGELEPSLVRGKETHDSHWKKIRMLHAKMRVISKFRGEKSCSKFSQASNKITCHCGQTHRLNSTNSDEVVNHCESTCDNKALVEGSCSTNFHDIFEVTQTIGKHEVRRRLEKRNSVSDGIVESDFKNEADKQKGIVPISDPKKEKMGMDYNNYQGEVHQRNMRLMKQRNSRYNDITCGFELGDGEEQLRLLMEIRSELKLLQSEMKSLKTKNAAPVDDNLSFGLLQEAMVHFWL